MNGTPLYLTRTRTTLKYFITDIKTGPFMDHDRSGTITIGRLEVTGGKKGSQEK